MKESIIEKKSIEFAKKIITLYKDLFAAKEFVISKQLLRSGTSIGANIQEAYFAQSKKDFINKMHIAAKEANETRYWMILLKEFNLPNIVLEQYFKDIDEIIKILAAIIKSSKQNL